MSMENFWDHHGWPFLLAMCCFPRLTMLVATLAGAGPLYWLGWLLLPRLTVATPADGGYPGHGDVLAR